MLPKDLFVFGLGSFLLGHIAYVVGMHVDEISGGRFLVGLVIVVLALVVIASRILRGGRAGSDPKLAGTVVAYMTVLSPMLASALGTGPSTPLAGTHSISVRARTIPWPRTPTGHGLSAT